ncbi:YfiR family protein [Pseudochryseolinea flava]|uniref:YfiR family protein n=1 Tax=Pseudochryseolinea flava TaxID=2059302 RepID=A0A364XV87_9BACT|nr:YfiR family protein [Pseudochryseolinea flava]RAV98232.1 YfiR family protein [Pseudochryseolinea flava]
MVLTTRQKFTFRFSTPNFVLLLCALLTISVANSKAKQPMLEYQVKAVFLYNFAQFVEWPKQAFTTDNAPLIIGVLGADPFGSYLDKTVKGENVNGHPIIVKRFQKIEDIKNCHILFINITGKDRVREICEQLNAKNVLTVSDMPNFTKQGGIVKFYVEDNKTKIRINLEASKRADLSISSKLLRVAEIVNN